MLKNDKQDKKLRNLFDRLILAFKLLDEEKKELISEECEGHEDLLFRITLFKEKLSKDQVKKFENEFGKTTGIPDSSKTNLTLSNQDIEASKEITTTSETRSGNTWQKKLLRKIVIKTHPDKLMHFPDADKEFYTDVCRGATQFYNEYDDVKLMMTGCEVRIRPASLNSHHSNLVIERNKNEQLEIDKIKTQHGYIWYHLNDIDKEIFLTNYMKQLGYTISTNEIIDAIKTRRPESRKPGTRPEKKIKRKVV
jgi:hypothetical protein